MNDKIVEDLIEQAKQIAKEKFLTFAESIYGTDRETWDHLWEIPIVSTYEDEKIFPTNLSSISREKLIDVLDECIESEIGDSEAVFISFDDIIASLPDEAAREYESAITDGKIIGEHNAVIVYNEAVLKRSFKELVKAGKEANPPRTQEEIGKDFLGIISEIFIHEILHLNANALVIDIENPDLLEELNGSEVKYDGNYRKHNEVLLDTMAKIIQIYSEGDTIEECLERVIESRGGESAYEELDDRLVLSLFTLFPNELSKWTMFEAYDEQHNNLLEEKYAEVFGGNVVLRRDDMLKKVGEYFNNAVQGNISEEALRRKKMLEMLGVKNINLQSNKLINSIQIKELVTNSTITMKEVEKLEFGLNELCNEAQQQDIENER